MNRYSTNSVIVVVSILMFCALSAIPLQAQTNLPELELVVQSIEGSGAEYRADTAPEGVWGELEEDQTLNRGDHIRTGEATTVRLEVPGISFLKVTPSTTLQLNNLNRTTEERGLLATEEVTVNEIDIETEEGKVQNSVREHEGVATEYDLQTPNAVAGVRGTDFQCEISTFGRTECAVGEGEVQFASRANPESAVTLRAGQKSRMEPDATEPSEPEDVSETEAQELQQVQEESRSALLLPPVIEGINLNGTEFEESIRIEYNEPSELTLAGRVSAQDDDATVENVSVLVNGEAANVDGVEEWSVTRTPEVPPEGSERTAQFVITATDSNNNSTTREVSVTLVNSEETGEAQSIPPENYEEGNVPVEVITVVGQSVGDIEFPYHAYQGDATSEGLMVEGTASGDATIEGVAYSLDDGQSWELATGSENWQVPIPAQSSGEYTVQIVAWTTDGVIGETAEVGPIVYEAISYSQVIRRTFEDFWVQFDRENTSNMLEYLDQNFNISFANGETADRSEFENYLDNQFFPGTENLRSDYTINQVFGTPTGGQIEVDRLEWRGQFTEENMGSGGDGGSGNLAATTTTDNISLPFASVPNGSYSFQRQSNGQYRFLSIEDVSDRPFIGIDEDQFENFLGGKIQDDADFVTTGIWNGFAASPNNGFYEEFEILSGYVMVGLDNVGFSLSADSNPQIYANDNNPNVCAHCPGSFPVQRGGVAKVGNSSFSRVQSIPEIGSGALKGVVEVQTGDIVAVNVETDFGEQVVFLMKVTDVNLGNNPPSLRARFVQPAFFDGKSVTEFRGANPFQN